MAEFKVVVGRETFYTDDPRFETADDVRKHLRNEAGRFPTWIDFGDICFHSQQLVAIVEFDGELGDASA